MRKKIVGFFICMVLITIIPPLTAMAGDENDPEITDNLDDQFGALVDHPLRIRTRIALSLLKMTSFDLIDIESAWFYENEFESNFLFAVLKLKDLSITPQRAIYSIHWMCNGKAYCVWSHLYNNAQNYVGAVGLDRRFNYRWSDAEVIYDFDRNIIIFKMEKKYIGEPQPGNLVMKPWAWTALRFNFEPFCLLFSDGELIKDGAPFIENNQDYGREYVIQY